VGPPEYIEPMKRVYVPIEDAKLDLLLKEGILRRHWSRLWNGGNHCRHRRNRRT